MGPLPAGQFAVMAVSSGHICYLYSPFVPNNIRIHTLALSVCAVGPCMYTISTIQQGFVRVCLYVFINPM